MSNDNRNDVRNLWQSQANDAPNFSLSLLKLRAQGLAWKVKLRNAVDYVATVGCIVGLPIYVWRIKPSALEIAGWVCALLGSIYFLYYLRKHGRSMPVRIEGDIGANLQSLIAEYRRQRDLHLAGYKWYILPFIPAFVLLLLARWNAWPTQQSVKFIGLVIAIAYSTTWWHNLLAKRIQRSIDELERVRNSLHD